MFVGDGLAEEQEQLIAMGNTKREVKKKRALTVTSVFPGSYVCLSATNNRPTLKAQSVLVPMSRKAVSRATTPDPRGSGPDRMSEKTQLLIRIFSDG